MAENGFHHEYYMKEALKEARKALEKGEVPVGVIIVCRNKVIARAHNLTETLNDVTAHAEMQAITAAANHLGGKYLNECTMYVTVEPCIMCGGACFWSQVGTIVYGTQDEKRGYQTIRDNILHPGTQVIGGLLENECRQILQDFFAARR